MLRQIAGREDVPVFMGADRPLRRTCGGGEFHGPEGLGDMTPFEPDAPVAEGHAATPSSPWSWRAAGQVRGAGRAGAADQSGAGAAQGAGAGRAAGPVAVMGGARSEGGNITASAEFNIWADPEAAAEVLATDCDVVMFGLDVTHQVRATEERIAAIEALGTPMGDTAAAMMRFSQAVERRIVGWDAPPVHDPVRWPGC
jgi:purine nucleosidase